MPEIAAVPAVPMAQIRLERLVRLVGMPVNCRHCGGDVFIIMTRHQNTIGVDESTGEKHHCPGKVAA